MKPRIIKPGQVLLVIILLLVPEIIFGQDTLVNDKSIVQKLGEDVRILGEDAAGFFTAPLNFSGSDWLYAAGFTGTTMLMFAIDNTAKRNIGRKTILSLNKDFWDIPTTYGIVAYANGFSLAAYTAGLLSGSDELRTTGRMLFETLSISGVSVMVLRYVFGRIRPYYNEGPLSFYWFEKSNEIQSFPSGHTVVAFAMSTVLANRIQNIWASLGLFGLSSLTGFSRVYNNQHWLSDVVAGALLGIGTGLFIVGREEERLNSEKTNNPELTFYPSFTGLNLVLKF